MIYLVSHNPALLPVENIYVRATADQAYAWLSSLREIFIDTETNGFDPHTSRLVCVQMGNEVDQYIIDTDTVRLDSFKGLLESRQLVGHHLKFDLKFLYKQGVYPRKIYDTFIAERVIHCGNPEMRAGLDVVAQRYLGRQLDKSIRVDIGGEGLSPRVIRYAATDIEVLPGIKGKQENEIAARDLRGTVNLENRFTPVLAYIEYCGFYLNAQKWTAKMKKDLKELKEAEDALNEWVISNGLSSFMEDQLDLFEPPQCAINWASPRQVTELFERLGIDCNTLEKGITKKSIEAGILEKQAAEFPIIALYLRFKKAQKVQGTYGESFIRQINPSTGRLHTSFNQVMDTGRVASGGKNRETGEEYINFQNIPSDAATRSCFGARPGNVLVIADYSGQEQVVLANKAQDPNLLKFYDEGLGDMHSFVAQKMYPELEELSLEEIKTHYKEKRQAAKSAGFAINYGGTGSTIADNLGLSKEEGDQIYQAYFQAFPGLKNYFDRVKKQVLKDGFILISEITRRKFFFPYMDRFREMEAQMTAELWEVYRSAKASKDDQWKELRAKVSDYFYYKGEIERKALNFPIQGSSAEITKISGYFIFKWILDHDLFGVVKFVNTVHDEHVVECPEEMKEEVAAMVKDAMSRAADMYCQRVPLKAELTTSPYWKK